MVLETVLSNNEVRSPHVVLRQQIEPFYSLLKDPQTDLNNPLIINYFKLYKHRATIF